MRLCCFLPFAVAACGNNLPPSGECMAPAGGGTPTVESVALTGDVYFDDLDYSAALGQVVAAPEGANAVYLIEPTTMAVTTLPVSGDVASADAAADLVFAAERPFTIHILDPVTGEVGTGTAAGGIDYVRVSPDGNQVWLSEPGAGRLEVMTIVRESPPRLESLATIATPGAPEGLHFDSTGAHAYTQSGGRVIEIDTANRTVSGNWDDGCDGSHGFPMADPARDLAIGGCRSGGGGAVIDRATGELVSGFEAGGGAAILAYSEALAHFYLRGDGNPSLSILGLCRDGTIAELAKVTIPMSGHGAAADQDGHVWVADPLRGGVVRVTDPFPQMP